MAKLPRELLKLFGSSGATSNFGKFGSQAAGSAVNTKDISTIQGLSAYLAGWQSAINVGSKAPYLEDMNSLFYLLCYQMCYQLQEGVAEYDSATTYWANSIVKKTGTLEIYACIDSGGTGTVGVALPNKVTDGYWKYVGDFGDLNNASNLVNTISDSVHGSRGGGTLHSLVTTAVNGFMSATDKGKLDGLTAGTNKIYCAVANMFVNGGEGYGYIDLVNGQSSGTINNFQKTANFPAGIPLIWFAFPQTIYPGASETVRMGLPGTYTAGNYTTYVSNTVGVSTVQSGNYGIQAGINTGNAYFGYVFIGIQ